MEINNEKELQALRSEFNLFKEKLGKQDKVNEKFFRSLRKRPALAISKEMKDRMLLDVLTAPAVIIICVTTDWPLLFGILVSLWALTDLGVSVWVGRKLGMDNLLNDDVRTVTGKIAGYRKFYMRALLVSIVPLTAMLSYIFIHLHTLTDDPAALRLITLSGIISIFIGAAITVHRYKKHVERCKELMGEFDDQ